jgi:hypothetical protein
MSIDPAQKALFQIAELDRRAKSNARMGTIHEIKGDKMRVNWGLDHEGQPCIGPWIQTTDHRGGETQQEVYKVGQNVEMSCLGGDFSQASVAPHGPNEKAPAPSHASEGNSTWQQGGSAHTRNGDSTNHMHGDGNNPNSNHRTSAQGTTGFAKVGGAYNRYQSHAEGVIISYKDDEHAIWCDKKGPACTAPLRIDKPTIPKDNGHK